MKKTKYLDDLSEIKNIMSKTTRFISLSGLSGVSTGSIALVGVLTAFLTVFKENRYLVFKAVELTSNELYYLLIAALGTLILSVISVFYFTRRKTKKQNESTWNNHTKQLVINLSIPLVTGGLICIIFLQKGYIGILPPLTLIFYGLALVNGSKYTFPEIRNLGLIEIFLGLLALLLIDYALIFWAFGFGLVQILCGLIIQRKY